MRKDTSDYVRLAEELLALCSTEDSPADLLQWLSDRVKRLGEGDYRDALMTWEESFDLADEMLTEYAVHAAHRAQSY